MVGHLMCSSMFVLTNTNQTHCNSLTVHKQCSMQVCTRMRNIGHRAVSSALGYSRGRQCHGLPFARPPQNGATHTLFLPGGCDADSRVHPRRWQRLPHLGVRCGLSLGLQEFGRQTRVCEDPLLTVSGGDAFLQSYRGKTGAGCAAASLRGGVEYFRVEVEPANSELL